MGRGRCRPSALSSGGACVHDFLLYVCLLQASGGGQDVPGWAGWEPRMPEAGREARGRDGVDQASPGRFWSLGFNGTLFFPENVLTYEISLRVYTPMCRVPVCVPVYVWAASGQVIALCTPAPALGRGDDACVCQPGGVGTCRVSYKVRATDTHGVTFVLWLKH